MTFGIIKEWHVALNNSANPKANLIQTFPQAQPHTFCASEYDGREQIRSALTDRSRCLKMGNSHKVEITFTSSKPVALRTKYGRDPLPPPGPSVIVENCIVCLSVGE